MSDNPLVPVSSTLFTKDALDAAVAAMIPQLPPGRTHGVGFALDARGAQFAVLFGSQDGNWHAQGAVAIDPAGHVSAGVQGVITF